MPFIKVTQFWRFTFMMIVRKQWAAHSNRKVNIAAVDAHFGSFANVIRAVRYRRRRDRISGYIKIYWKKITGFRFYGFT